MTRSEIGGGRSARPVNPAKDRRHAPEGRRPRAPEGTRETCEGLPQATRRTGASERQKRERRGRDAHPKQQRAERRGAPCRKRGCESGGRVAFDDGDAGRRRVRNGGALRNGRGRDDGTSTTRQRHVRGTRGGGARASEKPRNAGEMRSALPQDLNGREAKEGRTPAAARDRSSVRRRSRRASSDLGEGDGEGTNAPTRAREIGRNARDPRGFFANSGTIRAPSAHPIHKELTEPSAPWVS